MKKNNFQRLEEKEMERVPDVPLLIKQNVSNQIDGMRTIGNMFDVYISRMFDMFVMMVGGKVERKDKKQRADLADFGVGSTPTDPQSAPPGGPGQG